MRQSHQESGSTNPAILRQTVIDRLSTSDPTELSNEENINDFVTSNFKALDAGIEASTRSLIRRPALSQNSTKNAKTCVLRSRNSAEDGNAQGRMTTTRPTDMLATRGADIYRRCSAIPTAKQLKTHLHHSPGFGIWSSGPRTGTTPRLLICHHL